MSERNYDDPNQPIFPFRMNAFQEYRICPEYMIGKRFYTYSTNKYGTLVKMVPGNDGWEVDVEWDDGTRSDTWSWCMFTDDTPLVFDLCSLPKEEQLELMQEAHAKSLHIDIVESQQVSEEIEKYLAQPAENRSEALKLLEKYGGDCG